MSNKEYTLSYTTPEESEKFVELGVKVNTADLWISPKWKCIGLIEEIPIKFKTLPCWSITRIVDILENNGVKVSYEGNWCLKTNVIENGLRHCFVGDSLPKLVIEMLESKIVKIK